MGVGLGLGCYGNSLAARSEHFAVTEPQNTLEPGGAPRTTPEAIGKSSRESTPPPWGLGPSAGPGGGARTAMGHRRRDNLEDLNIK